eukprot:s2796_g13.t1
MGCLFQLLAVAESSLLDQFGIDMFFPIQKAAEAAEMAKRTSLGSFEASPDEPARPKVPRRFGATMSVVTTSVGVPAQGRGYFAQDVDLKASRMEIVAPYLLPQVTTNMTTLSVGNHTWIETGGSQHSQAMCRTIPMFGPQGFEDMFSWASDPAISEYVGQSSVAGRSCAQWRLRSSSSIINETLCADGDIPVELNISMKSSAGGVTKESHASYRFDPLSTEVDSSLLEKPSICDHVAPPCENGRGVGPVTLDAYVFHPGLSAIDYSIEDQNVADLRGDALFICFDLMSNQSSFADHNYSLISRYSLQLSPAFGQYSACNGYPDTKPKGPVCIGGDTRLTGKEAPFFGGEGESRCADESPIGFWYSLPKAGHCPPGQAPSTTASESGCTWSIIKRAKTIHQTCLIKDHNFLASCKADFAQKDFARSTAALSAAFESEDFSKGGCPDIGGPESKEDVTSFVV